LAAAPTAVEAPELLLFQEIPIVVTASRVEERVTEAPASVTVITREQILNSGAISIADLLRMAPGVDVMQNTGADWDVSIRGFTHIGSNKVLVLIDGRTAYNDFYASVNWYELPVVLEDIERIEVIRGPLSSLWGANALLGVINIITRSAAQSQGTLATVQYGTRGTLRATAVHGGRAGNSGVSYKVSAAQEEVGQWTPFRAGAQSPIVDNRKAGQVSKANLTAEWIDSQGGAWAASAGTSNGDVVLLLDLTGTHKLWDERTGYLMLDYRRNDLDLRAYWNNARLNYMQTGWPAASVIRSDLYDLEALKSQGLGRHNLVYGGAFRHKELSQAGLLLLSGPQQQSLWAAYVEDDYRASARTRLVLGTRYDHDPLAGGCLSGRATAMYALSPDRTLRFSVANAFRAPNFLESYLQVVSARLFGNTDLDPESITSYDLEYRARLSPATSASVAAYYSQLEDLIHVQQIMGPPSIQLFSNLGGARARGVELEVAHTWSPTLSGFANYTYQSLTGDAAIVRDRPDVIYSSPRHKANVGLTLANPERGLNASLLLNYRDRTSAAGSGCGPYVLVNGYLGKRIRQNGELGLSFFNLANRRHQEYVDGDIIGARIMGSVRWQF
jgi:iron complex outermembrane receptor protein